MLVVIDYRDSTRGREYIPKSSMRLVSRPLLLTRENRHREEGSCMFDLKQLTTDLVDLPTETFEWGTLTWLCNSKLSLGAKQAVGVCHIHPGRGNPVHYHPNCEEVLHMLAGTGRHSFDDQSIELRAGMTIRIPSGVRHNLTNVGDAPITCLIAFNSGERETVFLT